MARTYVTAPAYFYFFHDTDREIIIRPSDQLEDASLTFSEIITDQMSQASEARADAIVSGFNVEATVSIATLGNMDLFANIFQGSDDLSEGDRRLVGIASRPGCPVKKGPVMIKFADCDGPSTDANDWFYLPNGAFFTTDTTFNFSKTAQASYSITVAGFDPDETSDFYPYKALRGDIGLITGAPAPTPGGGTGGGGTPPAGAVRVNGLAGTQQNSTTTTGTTSPIGFTATDAASYIEFAPFTSSGTNPVGQSILYNGTEVALLDYFDGAIGRTVYIYIAQANEQRAITLRTQNTDFMTNTAV